MAIEFDCPGCGKNLKTGDDKAGRRTKCPQCGQPLTVPDGAASDDDYGAPPDRYEDDYDEYGEPRGGQYDDEHSDGYGDDYGAPPRRRSRKKPSGAGDQLANASMITGIISVMFSFVCCCSINVLVSTPTAIAAIVMGFMARSKAGPKDDSARTKSLAGIICGFAALAIVAAMVALIIIGLVAQPNQFNNFPN